MARHLMPMTLRVLLAMSLLLASCSPAKKHPPAEDPPNTISTEGGTITVDDPASSIKGLSIEVPKGSYTKKTTFKISARPYAGKKVPGLTPITPLIHVDNGGGFSAEPMAVTIPISLPADSFAMGFFVHPDGTLEGMPLTALSPTSITVVTRHFSEFLISMIKNIELPEKVTTGFAPGKDDWQFPNYGSFLAPGGHCGGQSASAMWYYYEKTQKGESSLYGLYDNNGQEKTPQLWEDDSWGYRLASTLQDDMKVGKPFQAFYNMGLTSPDLTWKAFLYSMHLTKEPQFIVIYNLDTRDGHAMVAYAADAKLGILRVADPNYPGNKRRWITYMNNTFVPYVSANNAKSLLAEQTSSFDLIAYSATTALVPWNKLAARWTELKDGSIGQGQFPSYGLMKAIGSTSYVAIEDGEKTTEENYTVSLSAVTGKPVRLQVYKDDKKIAEGQKVTLPLEMGVNLFGCLVQGKKNNSWEYIDYAYLSIERIEEEKPDEDDDDDEPKPKPVYDAVINGVYYGEVQSKTRTRGPMLYVTDATGKYPLRTAYRIISEKTGSFGNVIETHFQFKRGFGSPGVPPGARRVCVGPIPGQWTAKSKIINVGLNGTHKVTLGAPPPKN